MFEKSPVLPNTPAARRHNRNWVGPEALQEAEPGLSDRSSVVRYRFDTRQFAMRTDAGSNNRKVPPAGFGETR